MIYWRGLTRQVQEDIVMITLSEDRCVTTPDLAKEMDARYQHLEYFDTDGVYAVLMRLVKKGLVSRSQIDRNHRPHVEWKKVKH